MPFPSFEITTSRRRPVNVVHLEVSLDNLAPDLEGLKLVQLSDLHYGFPTSKSHIEKVITLVQSLSPDVILLTGDYGQVGFFDLKYYYATEVRSTRSHILRYRRSARQNIIEFAELIAPLTSSYPTFAVLGNHDYIEGKASVMRALSPQVHWLINSSAFFSRRQSSLQIAGVDDFLLGHPDLSKCIDIERAKVFPKPSSPTNEKPIPLFRILLSHNPDIVTHSESNILNSFDLVLCGHTHGGQIRIPFWGPIMTRTKQKLHVHGLQMNNTTAIYTSSGVGWGGIKLRLFCPPEVVVISLKSK